MNPPAIINDIVQRSIEIVGGHAKNMTATDVANACLNIQCDLHIAREKRLPIVIHYAFGKNIGQIQPYQLALLLDILP